MFSKIKFLLVIFQLSQCCFSQLGIPVYSDYLSDNYYLLHPSMAGAANCDKLRLTARTQWLDQASAPALQTLNYNGRVGEKSGVGIILFNDKNGYHSQKGAKLTYAHHLMFSRDEIDLNQLSFGMSANISQSQLDQTEFLQSGDIDPIINGVIIKDASYFNLDIGASYNFLDFYFHGTIQNIIESKREIYSEFESANLRKYLVSAGYIFGNKNRILWEPSIMFQLIDQTKEKLIDINLKVYKNMDWGKLWGAMSYRTNFDTIRYQSSTGTLSQKLQYITPIIGANYRKFMFAYTFSYLPAAINFGAGGFHQITLGVNINCKRDKYECNCPAIN
jgi:type IX secretion system PorP/SprF family membrane protein